MTCAPIKDSYDVIIVGAGASGCVLAGRLSEIPSKRVLLIEAGPDVPPGREHADIRDPYPVSSGNPRFFWPGLTAEVGADLGNDRPRNSAPYLQGLGVGGGSNVNGMAADRGKPADYDMWRDLGASGWGWGDVLPYFKKLEHDVDLVGPAHGKDGPIPIRRLDPQQWAPFAKAFARIAERRGAVLTTEPLDDSRAELSSMPMNSLANRRVSASMAYLTEQVRRRPNFTILSNTRAERIHVRNGAMPGVMVRTGALTTTLWAPEIILSCGTVLSPALLLRSGIGPAEQLGKLGLDTVCDLPGVGRNLQNHPLVSLAVHLTPAGMQSATQRAWQQSQLRYSSLVSGCPPKDMLIFPVNKTAWHALGRSIAVIAVMVGNAYSKGHVELASADPAVAPRVRFNVLDDSRDFERLVDGTRLALEMLNADEMLGVRDEVLVPDAAIVARLAQRSIWTRLGASLISSILRIGSLRRTLLRKSILDVRAMASSEHSIRHYVRANAYAVHHACGTCRMGSSGDPGAVVDSSCRVFGIPGLRVIDASVFPAVPSGETHLPVLMVAEKMADQIKAEWREQRTHGVRTACKTE